MPAVPAEHTGVATGMNANNLIIGGAVGTAVVAGILAVGTTPTGFPSKSGWDTVFLVLAGTGAAGLASCLLIPATRTHWAIRDKQPEEPATELIDQHNPF